jgi:hypothetical protein
VIDLASKLKKLPGHVAKSTFAKVQAWGPIIEPNVASACHQARRTIVDQQVRNPLLNRVHSVQQQSWRSVAEPREAVILEDLTSTTAQRAMLVRRFLRAETSVATLT